jgi:hypothetical protein
MPQVIKSLIVVLFFAVAIFLVARSQFVPGIMTEKEFATRRNTWFALTLFAYLTHNFWIFLTCAAILIWVVGRRDQNPLALFCLAIFALPPFLVPIPAPGGAGNSFFDINPTRLFSLCVLLPYSLVLWRRGVATAPALRFSTRVVAALLIYVFIIQAVHFSEVTAVVRSAIYLIADFWLPFYAASRGLSSIKNFREVAGSFVLALSIVGVLATFESLRRWNVYDILVATLGFPGETIFLARAEGGPLRARLMTGWPIVLGYLMIIGLAMTLYLAKHFKSRFVFLLCLAATTLGLISSFSRGPWVGAMLMVTVFFLAGPGISRRIFKAAFVIVPLGALFLASPFGAKVIDYLPFVGSVDVGSVTYRTMLFNLSLEVFLQNPWFGDLMFMRNPMLAPLRQGQGIIDITNTYLLYALPYGLIGLLLFVAPFAKELVSSWRAREIDGPGAVEHEILGRALVACMLGLLFTLVTASTIHLIPGMLYFLLGSMSAYAALRETSPAAESTKLNATAPRARTTSSTARHRNRPAGRGSSGA